jgi:hypothetical protein
VALALGATVGFHSPRPALIAYVIDLYGQRPGSAPQNRLIWLLAILAPGIDHRHHGYITAYGWGCRWYQPLYNIRPPTSVASRQKLIWFPLEPSSVLGTRSCARSTRDQWKSLHILLLPQLPRGILVSPPAPGFACPSNINCQPKAVA